MATTQSGRCACGRIRYTVTGALRSVSNCHCEPCRRITGHHMAATAADASQVAIADDADMLSWYERTPDIHYGFCRQCGSSLFWRATNKPGHLSITAGTLDQPTGLQTTLALYGDQAGDYHHLDPSIETLAGDRDLVSCPANHGVNSTAPCAPRGVAGKLYSERGVAVFGALRGTQLARRIRNRINRTGH